MSRFRRGTNEALVENTNIARFPQTPEQQLLMAANSMVSRAALSATMGKSYDGERDIYTALGYKKNLVYGDYYARYKRQDVAKRVVVAPVDSCWRKKPELSESKESETAFEKGWEELVKEHKVYHYLSRADKIAGIGQYSVLLVGLDDGQEDLMTPVDGKAKGLLFLRPYSQQNADITTWETNQQDPRYGKPLIYTLKPSGADKSKVQHIKCHYSRIIHVAEGCEEDDIYGVPRLEVVYNRLQDLELVSGGSAEMFWRGAFPGLGLNADEQSNWDPQTLSDIRTEVESYMHGMKRYLRLKGIEIQELSTQVANPDSHVSILLDLISGATGIPKRILIGSERGELASSQDENNWNARVDERRRDFVEPVILRPFVDLMIETGILQEPKEDYAVEWPDIVSPDENEKADVAFKKTEALAKYASSPGADIIMPPEFFLKKILGFTQDEIDEMEEMLQGAFEQERLEIAEERATLQSERTRTKPALPEELEEIEE